MALVLAVADLLHRLERPAFVEDREPAQQPLLRGVEQRVAPADRRAQRALAKRQIAIARRQQVERVIEPLEQRRGLEDSHARRGELERQRQAVEPAADRGDRRRVRGREREAGLHLLRTLEEERDRRALLQRVEARSRSAPAARAAAGRTPTRRRS